MKAWEERIPVQAKKKLVITPRKGFDNSVMISFEYSFGCAWMGDEAVLQMCLGERFGEDEDQT